MAGSAGSLGSYLRERLLSEDWKPRVPAHEGPKKVAGWFAERLADRREARIRR